MDLWYTNLVLATLARIFWSKSHLSHATSTPCKYGPPWCSHLGGDSIHTTGFIVYIPQRLAALALCGHVLSAKPACLRMTSHLQSKV